MNKIREFLRRHNYIVNVKVEDKIARVTFEDKINVTYEVKEDEELCTINAYYHQDGESICVYKFICRWYILLDIFRICRKYDIPYTIIEYVDKDENPGSFIDLLKLNMTEDELKLEKEFEPIIVAILQDKKKINDYDDLFVKGRLFMTWKILKGLLV